MNIDAILSIFAVSGFTEHGIHRILRKAYIDSFSYSETKYCSIINELAALNIESHHISPRGGDEMDRKRGEYKSCVIVL